MQTEFRKLRRKRAAAGCESRKIMGHLSENPSECSVRPASNRTKFSVRFCGLRQCHVHFSIVISPSTVTQRCDASRQTQAKLAAAGFLSIQTSSGAGQFSLFTDDLLHVLSKCASSQKLKLCPECCLERKSRASILDWVSIGKPKFSFSFCLFGERRKVRRRRERKWKR